MTSMLGPDGKLDSISIDKLWAQQDPFGHAACAIDLSGVKLVTPGTLVQLTAACYALAHIGRHPVIMVDDVSVSPYLMRAGFMQVVESVASFEPNLASISHAYDSRRGASPMLIEVTSIESPRQLSDPLGRIIAVLQDRFSYAKYDAFDVAMAVSEMCQNTLDHNLSPCGFLAMQVYGGRTKRFLEIRVADYGAGLAASLRRNPKYSPALSDRQAIALATKLGTSEYDDVTRGTGLYHLLEIVYKHQGSAQIRSGAAKTRYRVDETNQRRSPDSQT